jgi:hypothetical protein
MKELHLSTAEMYGVVSDVFCGKSLYCVETAEQAEHDCYREMLNRADEDTAEFTESNFRAWPLATWPHDLTFEEAFDWIGEQKTKAKGGE